MKAVLIINMPEYCIDCPAHFYNDCSDDMFVCGATRKRMDTEDIQTYKPDWCPLRELPEAKSEEFGQTIINSARAEGWNACLRVITGTQDVEG